MAVAVEMPKLGNTVEECLLARWTKSVGERLAEGEIIAEIETDKANFEIAAPAAGVLLERFFEEGALVPVFTPLCAIGEPGENVESLRPRMAEPQQAPAAQPVAKPAAPAAPPVAAPEPVIAGTFLSPRARSFAREHSMDARGVRGSGPGGRVLEQDLRELYFSRPRLSSLARRQAAAGYEASGSGSGMNGMVLARDLQEPPTRLSSIRERIARRMRESMSSTAQYTLHGSADATGLLRLRAAVKARGATPDININDMVLFATVKALLRMPELNAEFRDGKLFPHTAVNLGFACDTDRGLLVPVVKDAHLLSLPGLASAVKDLTQRALDGTLSPDDMSGATFTVSNLGSLGIESFTPILNPPQVALLGVDTIELRPVRRNGAIEFVDHIGLSLTCDHQVIDGAPGARFLRVVREFIECIESL